MDLSNTSSVVNNQNSHKYAPIISEGYCTQRYIRLIETRTIIKNENLYNLLIRYTETMVEQKETLQKSVRNLEYITIIWNTFEGIATVYLGILASSISLISFGLSSGLEVFAGAVVLWEMKQKDRSKERIALKLIGAGYFFVAGYALWNAYHDLLAGHHANQSLLGIIFSLATVIVMFTLAFLKINVGKKLKSSVVLAEANYSLIDGSLAGAVCIGLVCNALFGWWWADQVIAIGIAFFSVKEGIEEWKA